MIRFILDVLKFVVTSGLILAVIDILKSEKTYLKDQVHYVYGPISFILRRQAQLWEIAKEIRTTEYKYFGNGEQFSKEPQTQKSIKEDLDATLTKATEIEIEAVSLNGKIIEILQSRYSYVDDDDRDIIDAFLNNHDKYQLLVISEKKLPDQISLRMSKIQVIMPEFTNKINQKLIEKNKCQSYFRLICKLLSFSPRSVKTLFSKPFSIFRKLTSERNLEVS